MQLLRISITPHCVISIVSVGLYDHFESVLLTDYDRFPQTLQRKTSSKSSGLCQHTAVSLVQWSIISVDSAPG